MNDNENNGNGHGKYCQCGICQKPSDNFTIIWRGEGFHARCFVDFLDKMYELNGEMI